MIKLPVFAFLTGLYFAILQFCYLILLQVNISSAYLTYMIIVVSWFAGSLVGLWLKNLNVPLGVILGLLSYYGVYGLVVKWPFSSFTLFLASFGVFVTGLWAGRFFVFILSGFKTVDRLFFHENNGFLLGILLFFVGFTLLGREFSLWAPILLGSSLLVFNGWIPDRKSAPATQEGNRSI
ncbi:MAG: hypothetical protein ACE5E9_09825 [Nitrospinaceae bacterium]